MSIATTPPVTFAKTVAQLTCPTIEDSNKRIHRPQRVQYSKQSLGTPPLMVKQQTQRDINELADPAVARRVSLPSLNNLLSYSQSHFNARDSLKKVEEGDPSLEENSPRNGAPDWKTTEDPSIFQRETQSKSTPRALPNLLRASDVVAVDPAYYDQRRESLDFLADTALNSSKSSSINYVSPDAPNVTLEEENPGKDASKNNSQYLEMIAKILALKNSMFQNLSSWPIGETGSTPLIYSVSKSELQQLLTDSRKLTSTTRDLLLLKLQQERNSNEKRDISIDNKLKEGNIPKREFHERHSITLPSVASLTKPRISSSTSEAPHQQPTLPVLPPTPQHGYTFQQQQGIPSSQWNNQQSAFKFPSVGGNGGGSRTYDPLDRGSTQLPTRLPPFVQNNHKNISTPARNRTFSVSLRPFYQQQQQQQNVPLNPENGQQQTPVRAHQVRFGSLQHQRQSPLPLHPLGARHTLPSLRQRAADLNGQSALPPPPPPTFHRLSVIQPDPQLQQAPNQMGPVQGHRHVLSEPSLPTMAVTQSTVTNPRPANKRKRQRRTASTSGNIGGASVGVCLHCQERDTPEWRRGPYGNRTLCNACGLFYNKLIKKFGARDANIMMHYRRRMFPDDRRVPDVVEVSDSFVHALQQRTDLDDQYAVIQPQS